jgi:hypothetical protein
MIIPHFWQLSVAAPTSGASSSANLQAFSGNPFAMRDRQYDWALTL